MAVAKTRENLIIIDLFCLHNIMNASLFIKNMFGIDLNYIKNIGKV